MIDGIIKKNLFQNRIDELPEEVYELAYRYAMTGGRVSEMGIARDLSRSISFTDFINCSFWWDRTVEGEQFWFCIYDDNFHAEAFEDDLNRIKSYIDFKHFK